MCLHLTKPLEKFLSQQQETSTWLLLASFWLEQEDGLRISNRLSPFQGLHYHELFDFTIENDFLGF